MWLHVSFRLDSTARDSGDSFKVPKASKNPPLHLYAEKPVPSPAFPIPVAALPNVPRAGEASKSLQPGYMGPGLSREE